MGSSSKSSAPAPTMASAPTSAYSSSGNMMMMYAALLAQLQASSQAQLMQSQMQQSQAQPAMPVATKVPDIDWSEKNAQLRAKSRADYTLSQNKRKTVIDTIHTSPLLDDETPNTTQQVLG